MNSKKLYRAGKDHVLGGVCAGMAEYFSIDVIIVRVIWLILTLVHGIGAVAYVVCLVLIPKNPLHEQLPLSEQKKAENNGLYIGIGLIIIGLSVAFHRWFDFYFWDLDWLFFSFHWKIVWPVLFILFGAWFIYRSLKNEDEGASSKKEAFHRSTRNKWFAGVCGGLAEYWHVDVTLVRVAYALATIFTAVWLGVIAYVVLTIVIKEKDVIQEAEVVQPEPEEKKAAPKRRRASPKKQSDETKASDPDSKEEKEEGGADEQK